VDHQFVREFISDLVDPSPAGESAGAATINHPRPSPFLVRNTDHEGKDQWQLFIDTGVYTRNRMFRVLGSSKYRKAATLQLHPGGDDRFNFSALLSTLVCPFPSQEAMLVESPATRLLRCSQVGAMSHRAGRQSLLTATRVSSSRAVECRQSVYPQLDVFIRSQATRGGVQGEIRAIQMLFPPVQPRSEEGRGEETTTPKPWMITFHMAKNRWCGNVGRAHRSNNVMFVVDLSLRVYYQKCHDPACQAIDYRYAIDCHTPHAHTHALTPLVPLYLRLHSSPRSLGTICCLPVLSLAKVTPTAAADAHTPRRGRLGTQPARQINTLRRAITRS
jgi:hypothetical protein